MRSKQISSRMTFAYKVVIPFAFIAALAFSDIVAWWTDGPISELAIITVLSLLFFVVFCFPLKKVVLEEDHLVVSNFIATTTIPLSEVDQVDSSMLSNVRRTKIRLKTKCRFGRVIVFVPPCLVALGIFTPHPDVELLRARCQHLGK